MGRILDPFSMKVRNLFKSNKKSTESSIKLQGKIVWGLRLVITSGFNWNRKTKSYSTRVTLMTVGSGGPFLSGIESRPSVSILVSRGFESRPDVINERI